MALFFKIVIAYDGLTAAQRASGLRARLAAHFGPEFGIEDAAWNFALLAHPRLSEEAARQAVEADMIVIAANDDSELPLMSFIG